MSRETTKKRDFIEFIASMSDVEINEYIKRHGKKPKPMLLYTLVNKNSVVDNE